MTFPALRNHTNKELQEKYTHFYNNANARKQTIEQQNEKRSRISNQAVYSYETENKSEKIRKPNRTNRKIQKQDNYNKNMKILEQYRSLISSLQQEYQVNQVTN